MYGYSNSGVDSHAPMLSSRLSNVGTYTKGSDYTPITTRDDNNISLPLIEHNPQLPIQRNTSTRRFDTRREFTGGIRSDDIGTGARMDIGNLAKVEMRYNVDNGGRTRIEIGGRMDGYTPTMRQVGLQMNNDYTSTMKQVGHQMNNDYMNCSRHNSCEMPMMYNPSSIPNQLTPFSRRNVVNAYDISRYPLKVTKDLNSTTSSVVYPVPVEVSNDIKYEDSEYNDADLKRLLEMKLEAKRLKNAIKMATEHIEHSNDMKDCSKNISKLKNTIRKYKKYEVDTYWKAALDELCSGIGSLSLALCKIINYTGRTALDACSSISDDSLPQYKKKIKFGRRKYMPNNHEYGLADNSINYLSLNGRATPGDRGEYGEYGDKKHYKSLPGRTDYMTSSGLPVADLWEAEGQLNREGHHGEWKTSGGARSVQILYDEDDEEDDYSSSYSDSSFRICELLRRQHEVNECIKGYEMSMDPASNRSEIKRAPISNIKIGANIQRDVSISTSDNQPGVIKILNNSQPTNYQYPKPNLTTTNITFPNNNKIQPPLKETVVGMNARNTGGGMIVPGSASLKDLNGNSTNDSIISGTVTRLEDVKGMVARSSEVNDGKLTAIKDSVTSSEGRITPDDASSVKNVTSPTVVSSNEANESLVDVHSSEDRVSFPDTSGQSAPSVSSGLPIEISRRASAVMGHIINDDITEISSRESSSEGGSAIGEKKRKKTFFFNKSWK